MNQIAPTTEAQRTAARNIRRAFYEAQRAATAVKQKEADLDAAKRVYRAHRTISPARLRYFAEVATAEGDTDRAAELRRGADACERLCYEDLCTVM